jgi:dolichyl-phosphate beta-glucosyltransferase
MHGFHFFVKHVGGVHGVHDTQCGFKFFTRGAARRLFPSLHIERWAFDVELLFLASRVAVPVKECAGTEDVLTGKYMA